MEKHNNKYCNFREIKSFYIETKILSNLSLKRKLIFFSYNKKYQKKHKINLDTYKKISQRYKEAEKMEVEKNIEFIQI